MGSSKSTTITFTMVGSADQPSGPGCFRYKPPLKTLLQESRGGARLLVIEMETSKLQPACGYCAKWRTKEDNKGGRSCWVGCEGCLYFCLHVARGSALGMANLYGGKNNWMGIVQ